VFGACALIGVISFQTLSTGGPEGWNVLIMGVVAGLLLWMWFGTYYVITGTELSYRSGPVNGTIDIATIRKIEVGKTQYVGLKPSLANKGCVIHYNKYDEIYLSPQDKPGFVAALKSINPNIEVIDRS
jgi:hypothetical protein